MKATAAVARLPVFCVAAQVSAALVLTDSHMTSINCQRIRLNPVWPGLLNACNWVCEAPVMCPFHGDEIVGCLSERSSSSLALCLLAVGVSCRCWIWVVAPVSVFVSGTVAHALIIFCYFFSLCGLPFSRSPWWRGGQTALMQPGAPYMYQKCCHWNQHILWFS